jgi:hypothetical protein
VSGVVDGRSFARGDIGFDLVPCLFLDGGGALRFSEHWFKGAFLTAEEGLEFLVGHKFLSLNLRFLPILFTIMDELTESALTVMKLSPPMLIIVVGAILCMLLKPFVPERYLAPCSTVGSAAVAPLMFSNGSLAYDVPSPQTAFVLIGAVLGFIGSVLHRRAERFLKRRFNGSGDTKHIIREECEAKHAEPTVPKD